MNTNAAPDLCKAQRQKVELSVLADAVEIPAKPDIERIVLANLYAAPERAAILAVELHVGLFNDIRHRAIYLATRRLIEGGRQPDPILLRDELKRVGGTKDAGTVDYWASLPDDKIVPAMFPEHVETLRRVASLRNSLELSDRIRHAVVSGEDGDVLLEAARSFFDGLDGDSPTLQKHSQEWSVKRLLEPIDYAQTLLGDRYLERGGTMAVVAPSGIGKTVIGIQAAANWSIGRPAFHIKPSAALRVLVVQNEDTENDTKGPLQGIIANCGFSIKDVKVMHDNLKVVRLVALRGLLAATAIRDLATGWRADIIIVNPLMAYVPGKQGEETEVFLREHLQPIAAELRVGVIAIHHTPKIGRQNGVGTGANEYERQYNSAGKAEVVNAFRAILNIMPVGNGVFKFTADKRGRKIGWRWEDKPTIERYFKHASDPDNPDLIWWRDSTPEEAEQADQAGNYQDILTVLPEHGLEPISRERMRSEAKKHLRIGKDKADEWLKLAIEDKLADVVRQKNDSNRWESLFRRCEGVLEVMK